jgi:hypothetical protein
MPLVSTSIPDHGDVREKTNDMNHCGHCRPFQGSVPDENAASASGGMRDEG